MVTKVELLPVLLNGRKYRIDPTGLYAINSDGKAVRLEDPQRSNNRFK